MEISLADRGLPAARDLVSYVKRLHEATGQALADADDAAVDRVLLEHDAADTGWASSERVTIAAVTATWMRESITRGPRPQSVTLIQIETGYRAGGEGSVVVETYAWRGALSGEEASTVARIIRRGGAPMEVGWRES